MILMAACAPMSKEAYLKKYDAFIVEVSENGKSYDAEAWEKAAIQYEKFSGEWYNKFKEEMTLVEKLKVTKNQTQFYYYRNLSQGMSTAKEILKSLNIGEIKQQIRYYIDNNMESDLQKFYNDAVKAGKEAEEVVTKILNELNVKINVL